MEMKNKMLILICCIDDIQILGPNALQMKFWAWNGNIYIYKISKILDIYVQKIKLKDLALILPFSIHINDIYDSVT